MEKILILAEARTGSHRLYQLIRKYYNMLGYDKISQHEFFNSYNTKYELSNNERFAYFMDEANRDEFLVTKIILDQLHDYSIEQRQSIIDSFDRVVVLTRDNIHEQFLSFCIALAMKNKGVNRWWLPEKSDRVNKLSVSKSNVYSFFKHKSRASNVFSSVVLEKHQTLEYESLSKMNTTELFEFVGISTNTEIPDQSVKLDTLDEKICCIENYDEVMKWFIEFQQSPFEEKIYD